MKILLVEADFIREVGERESSFAKSSAPALGVNYLASILCNHGHKVIVLDSLYEYLRTNFLSPINIIKGTNAILEKEKNIECVGISITSPTRNHALGVAKEVKAYNPKIKVIGGGPHIAILQEMFLERFSQFFDFLVVGEGDKTLLELVSALDGKMSLDEVAGIVYIDSGGKIKKTNPRPILSEKEVNNVEIVPFTDYTQYQEILPDGIIPAISLVTTRGCPYRCAFCYSPRLWKKYREQSHQRVLAEIGYLIDKYKVKNIRFQDDTFTFNKNRCLKIFEGIKAQKWNIELYMHTRFDCIDEDIIQAYAEGGGKDIYFGLESGSQKLRKAMGKNGNLSNKKILEMCNVVRKHNINLGLWLIFGYPGETKDDFIMTNELLRKICPDEVTCNPVHVHPNTPLFKKAFTAKTYTIKNWLTEEYDFFPYIIGKKLQRIAKNCAFIENRYNSKRIRTLFETEYETIIEKDGIFSKEGRL
jgi:radical SAM superfamily enzyme YgiQ (UPF0313 family)